MAGKQVEQHPSSRGGMFSIREVEFLESLPAVERVVNGRIVYSDEFKRECLRRYNAGESPSEIFRRSGLDTALIGYKRIERCFARWKKSARLNSGTQAGAGESKFDVAPSLRWVAPVQVRRSLVDGTAFDDTAEAPLHESRPRERSREVEGDDERQSDLVVQAMIIRQQARRIGELEQEVKRLQTIIDSAEGRGATHPDGAVPAVSLS